MMCEKCCNQMICIHNKKVLDTNKDLWYTLYIWYCQDCGERKEESVYD